LDKRKKNCYVFVNVLAATQLHSEGIFERS